MSKQELAEGVAAKVIDTLVKDERNVAWLSRTTGIPYSTLAFKLKNRPQRLSHVDMILIASALGKPIEDFVPQKAAA